MEEKFGLIQGIECRYVKTDPEVIEAISKRTSIDITKVKSMMRYNIFTVSQFGALSQLAPSTILNKTRPLFKNKDTGELTTALDYCFPFQDADGPGPKFIVRNEKSEKYLQL